MSIRSSRQVLGLALALQILAVGCGGQSPEEYEESTTSEEQAVPGEVLVGVRQGMVGDATLEAKLSKVGEILSVEPTGNFYRLKVDETIAVSQIRAALASPHVLYVEQNMLVHPCAAPDDTYWATQYAGFGNAVRLQIEEALTNFVAAGAVTTSAPVRVAVIDTGVRGDHEDLTGKVGAGRNVLGAGSAISANANSDYGTGHGTQVAGVIAGNINNTTGIAGIAASDLTGADPELISIVPVKIGDASNPPNHASLAAGILWARSNADILVVAMDSGSPSYTLQNAVETAWATNGGAVGSRLIIAPAGNSNASSMRYPAAYVASNQGVLAVGSVSAADQVSANATTGSWVSVLAPGEGIITTTNTSTSSYSNTTPVSGASFSAAFAGGAAALVKAAYPTLTAAQLRNVLAASVDTFDPRSGKTLAQGVGRLNVSRALTVAGLLATTPGTPQLAGLTLSATTVKGGSTLTGIVRFTSNVTTNTAVTLAAGGSTAVSMPSTVTVLSGKSTATFTLSAIPVAASATVQVTATVGSDTISQAVRVLQPVVKTLTLSPASVTAGNTSVANVTLDAPAPTGGITVTFTTTDSNHMPAPAVATVTAGTTSKQVSVPTTNVPALTTTSTATLSAKITGSSDTPATAVLTLKTLISGVTLSSAAVKGGTAATGTVTLTTPATAATTVTLVSANTSAATVPATITIAQGSTVGSFAVTTIPQSTDTANFNITATVASISATVAMKVLAPVVSQVSFSPTTIMSGVNATGTVKLDAPAPTGGAVVTLSADDETVSIPASVTVAAAASTATFTVIPVAVVSDVPVGITATFAGASKTGTLSVKPQLANFQLSAQTIAGGTALTGTVTLSVAAPTGGITVALAVDSTLSPRVTITQGSSVTVAAGAKTATINLTTTANPVNLQGAITASVQGVSKSATLKLTAPTLTGFTLSAVSAMGGVTIRGTLVLSGPAPTGYTVALTSSNTSVANPSASVSVTAGSTGATFTFVALGVKTSTPATLTATANGSTKTVTFTALPTISSLALSPSTVSVAGTATSTATVTIATPAPTGGLVINVASADTSKATVASSTVTVAAGATSATFVVTGIAEGTSNITVSYGASTITSAITVDP